jgi:hypothetical protein
MEHKDPAVRAEMLGSEVEEIKANMESVQARLKNLPAGPIYDEFMMDLADMKGELAARENELAALLKAGGPGAPPK